MKEQDQDCDEPYVMEEQDQDPDEPNADSQDRDEPYVMEEQDFDEPSADSQDSDEPSVDLQDSDEPSVDSQDSDEQYVDSQDREEPLADDSRDRDDTYANSEAESDEEQSPAPSQSDAPHANAAVVDAAKEDAAKRAELLRVTTFAYAPAVDFSPPALGGADLASEAAFLEFSRRSANHKRVYDEPWNFLDASTLAWYVYVLISEIKNLNPARHRTLWAEKYERSAKGLYADEKERVESTRAFLRVTRTSRERYDRERSIAKSSQRRSVLSVCMCCWKPVAARNPQFFHPEYAWPFHLECLVTARFENSVLKSSLSLWSAKNQFPALLFGKVPKRWLDATYAASIDEVKIRAMQRLAYSFVVCARKALRHPVLKTVTYKLARTYRSATLKGAATEEQTRAWREALNFIKDNAFPSLPTQNGAPTTFMLLGAHAMTRLAKMVVDPNVFDEDADYTKPVNPFRVVKTKRSSAGLEKNREQRVIEYAQSLERDEGRREAVRAEPETAQTPKRMKITDA